MVIKTPELLPKSVNPHPNYPTENLTIKSWAEEDRPREKLLSRGKKELTDAELLAILLGSGSRKENALQLAKRILNSVDNDLHELGRRSIPELKRFKGIGEAKAVIIAAALELGHRRQILQLRQRPQIKGSQDAFQILSPVLLDLPHEEFWILLLNRANRVLGRERISIGGVAGTVVDAKVIFRIAVEYSACSLILSHNHPSGNLQPSTADCDLTQKLRQAAETLDIMVLDHLIISDSGYYSFADEGKM